MKQKKFIVVATGLLLLSLLTVAFAAWMFNTQVTSTMRVVVKTGNMQVLREDNSQPVTALSWGDYVTGDIVGDLVKNSTDAPVLGTRIVIKNTGSFDIVPAWNVTGLPAGFTLVCYKSAIGGATFAQNDYNSFRLLPNTQNGYLIFVLTLTDTAKAAGDYGFTLNFMAQQAP
jgi:hypothetical protein